MKILVVEPEKEPYVKDIENELSDMQEVVGGLIEPIYFHDDDKALVFCNEEFLLNGSEPNRMVEGTLVHGTFFVAGNREDDEGERGVEPREPVDAEALDARPEGGRADAAEEEQQEERGLRSDLSLAYPEDRIADEKSGGKAQRRYQGAPLTLRIGGINVRAGCNEAFDNVGAAPVAHGSHEQRPAAFVDSIDVSARLG